MKLDQLDAAVPLRDLDLPGNRLEAHAMQFILVNTLPSNLRYSK